MLLHFFAHAADLAFGDDVAVAEQDDLVGDGVDFVQDMAGDDDVHAVRGEGAEQGDGFGAGEGIEAVERLIEDEDRRAVADGLGQLDALPHAFAVAGDFAFGGIHEIDALEGAPGQIRSFLMAAAIDAQIGVDEFEAGQAFGEGVELGAVADFAKEALGVVGRDAQDRDRAAGGLQQAGHQVHQGGFAGAVGPDQAGDARRDGQADAVDAQHFAIELGDVVEDDFAIGGHSADHLVGAQLAAQQEQAHRRDGQQAEPGRAPVGSRLWGAGGRASPRRFAAER